MPERRRAALGALAAIDDGVGLITETLKKQGLTEKTLIFFIGDNGAPLKIHKIDSPLQGDAGGWDGSLNEPMNGEKGMLAEGGMHVPFLISWPGTIPGGQTYEPPVSALDVAATAVSIAGITTKPGELDGVDLIPYLKGEKSTLPHEDLFWRWSAQSAIREGNWKLLRGGEREYLYDLGTDPGEKANLGAKHPELAVKLRGKLEAFCAELDPPGLALGPMAPTWNDYFDFYLEGKTISVPGPKPSDSASATHGWEARGGTLVEHDGILTFTPETGGKGRGGFLTRSQLKLAGPVTALLELKATAGTALIAFRLDGEKDFLPANRVSFEIGTSGDWQRHEVILPAKGRVIHVRVQMPGGSSQFRTLELKPTRP